jgi:hypothetical protein
MPASLSQAGPIVSPTVLASGWVLQYTVPTGKVAKISGWDLVNKHASTSDTIKIAIGAGSDSNLIMPATAIAAGGHIPRYREMTLRAGQTIYSNAATGALVVFTVHGHEVTL